MVAIGLRKLVAGEAAEGMRYLRTEGGMRCLRTEGGMRCLRTEGDMCYLNTEGEAAEDMIHTQAEPDLSIEHWWSYMYHSRELLWTPRSRLTRVGRYPGPHIPHSVCDLLGALLPTRSVGSDADSTIIPTTDKPRKR